MMSQIGLRVLGTRSSPGFEVEGGKGNLLILKLVVWCKIGFYGRKTPENKKKD